MMSAKGEVMSVDELPIGKCPRCKIEALELGTPIMDVGKTSMRVSLKQCPRCLLLFYEISDKLPMGSFDNGGMLGDLSPR